MGQPLMCQGPGDPHLADVLVTMLANGDSSTWCMEHWVTVCAATVEAFTTPEVETTDAQAEAVLATVAAPAETASPAHVVRRGTSRSRAAYEARQRAKTSEMDAEPTSEPADEPGASVGGSGGTGDDHGP